MDQYREEQFFLSMWLNTSTQRWTHLQPIEYTYTLLQLDHMCISRGTSWWLSRPGQSPAVQATAVVTYIASALQLLAPQTVLWPLLVAGGLVNMYSLACGDPAQTFWLLASASICHLIDSALISMRKPTDKVDARAQT